jgi:hypothetical protein
MRERGQDSSCPRGNFFFPERWQIVIRLWYCCSAAGVLVPVGESGFTRV